MRCTTATFAFQEGIRAEDKKGSGSCAEYRKQNLPLLAPYPQGRGHYGRSRDLLDWERGFASALE
jgi:hypothetical protein